MTLTTTPETEARPVVLIAEELSPATVEALGPDFEIRHCNGADRAELLLPSPTPRRSWCARRPRSTPRRCAAAKRLKVVARAGVGLDNVDVKAATQNGVMVVNAPTSNIISAAELAVALMLAAARNISPAHAALTRGEWKRSRYSGIELFEKTVGIVGPGPHRRTRRPAARRLRHGRDRLRPLRAGRPSRTDGRAHGQPRRADDRVGLHQVHLPKTPETLGLIGADEFARARHRAWCWSTPPVAASSTRRRCTTP